MAVAGRFELEQADQEALSALGGWNTAIQNVEVGRRYNGGYVITFLNDELLDFPNWEQVANEVNALVREHNLHGFTEMPGQCAEAAQKLAQGDLTRFNEIITAIHDDFEENGPQDLIQQTCTSLKAIIDHVDSYLNQHLAHDKAEELIVKQMPNFIYMDDYRIFTGETQLKHLFEDYEKNGPDEANTLLMMMQMAGIDLETEIERCASTDQAEKDAQNLDIRAASQELTQIMAGKWSQGEYTIDFRINGYSFHTYVMDNSDPKMILLDERSKGFQWFFSFDLMFMYETQGTFKGAIILLDEPGLYLHIEAQRDLLKRMREYAQSNQLIYTSHLPFMIDPDAYASTRFVIREPGRGTWVTDDPALVESPVEVSLPGGCRFTNGQLVSIPAAQSRGRGNNRLLVSRRYVSRLRRGGHGRTRRGGNDYPLWRSDGSSLYRFDSERAETERRRSAGLRHLRR